MPDCAGACPANAAVEFVRAQSPTEKEQDEESKVTALLDAVDIEEAPSHHNDEWAEGVPAWLRDSQWWKQMQDRPYGYAATGRNHRSVGRRRIVSLCLGSKESDLAERVGFEPTDFRAETSPRSRPCAFGQAAQRGGFHTKGQ